MIAKAVTGNLYLGQVAILAGIVNAGLLADRKISAVSAAGVCRVARLVDGGLTAMAVIIISVSLKHGNSPSYVNG